jgi:hypothetical protein
MYAARTCSRDLGRKLMPPPCPPPSLTPTPWFELFYIMHLYALHCLASHRQDKIRRLTACLVCSVAARCRELRFLPFALVLSYTQ